MSGLDKDRLHAFEKVDTSETTSLARLRIAPFHGWRTNRTKLPSEDELKPHLRLIMGPDGAISDFAPIPSVTPSE